MGRRRNKIHPETVMRKGKIIPLTGIEFKLDTVKDGTSVACV